MGILNTFRLTANRFLQPSGFEFVRRQAATMERALSRLSRHGFKPSSVIDIGAASGTWTSMANPFLSDARFLMIEALQEREATLQELARTDPGRFQYQICAAGPKSGTTTFIVTEDLVGSGAATADGRCHGKTREVEMATLDELIGRHNMMPPYFLKFDTHGFELPILEGATDTLKSTELILMECYLFNGGKTRLLFWEMCRWMNDRGFRCFDLVDPLYRPKDQLLWQMDLFFARQGFPPFSDESYI